MESGFSAGLFHHQTLRGDRGLKIKQAYATGSWLLRAATSRRPSLSASVMTIQRTTLVTAGMGTAQARAIAPIAAPESLKVIISSIATTPTPPAAKPQLEVSVPGLLRRLLVDFTIMSQALKNS